VCHKAQPCYQGATLKISYKLFSLDELVSALEEQDLVSLQEELLFSAGNEICDGNAGTLSAEEERKLREPRHKYTHLLTIKGKDHRQSQP